jgi:hypothetical protein
LAKTLTSPCYYRTEKTEEEVAELVNKSQQLEGGPVLILHVTIGLRRLRRRWLSW